MKTIPESTKFVLRQDQDGQAILDHNGQAQFEKHIVPERKKMPPEDYAAKLVEHFGVEIYEGCRFTHGDDFSIYEYQDGEWVMIYDPDNH